MNPKDELWDRILGLEDLSRDSIETTFRGTMERAQSWDDGFHGRFLHKQLEWMLDPDHPWPLIDDARVLLAEMHGALALCKSEKDRAGALRDVLLLRQPIGQKSNIESAVRRSMIWSAVAICMDEANKEGNQIKAWKAAQIVADTEEFTRIDRGVEVPLSARRIYEIYRKPPFNKGAK